MRTPTPRTGSSLAVRLAAGATVTGVLSIGAGVAVAYLIADHSSSDSSPSSLTAIALIELGLLLALLGALLFAGIGLVRLWRRARRPPRGAHGG
jgi:hypothetical protein